MLNSLSKNTYKQYNGCIKAWLDYCKNNNNDYLDASIPVIIDFLTEIYNKGAKYGTINSYKSALSTLLGSHINDDNMKRFMKGVFRSRPTVPRYNLTWDPTVVLNCLSQKWPNADLDLETLSKKLLTLLALVTAHRVQTFSLIKINNIKVYDNLEIIIKIPDLIKTSKANSLQPLLKLPFFNIKPEICPAQCLITYIDKTKTLRRLPNKNLFISYRKPYAKVTSQTLSRWIKETLQESGIDTDIFSAHSTRHAATSRANKLGVNLDLIRKTAGWSSTSSVFAKYYNREIVPNSNQFANAVLSSNLDDL